MKPRSLLMLLFVFGSISAWAQEKRQVPLTTGDDIACFFAIPGEPQTLRFRSVSLPDGKALDYVVNDYTGQPTGQTGTAPVKEQAVAITGTFPIGYYEIRFPELDLVFGVASLPPFTGDIDPFYAIEGLISTRPRQQELVALMLRGGIRSNREWCHYPALEPVRGTVKTTRDGFYTMAGEAGFKSIFCFADFPEWYYEGVGKVGRRPPPRHLLGLDDSIRALLERRGPGLLAFHVLNEYDIYDIPGEAYVPTIKVAGYAMRGSALPLVGAPFCRGGGGSSVASSIDNGLLDFVDAFAFHSYSDPEIMIRQIREYRNAMAKHPKGAMPIWVTESGKPWSRGLDPAQLTAVYGGPLGALHPPADQDMLSAMWITMRAVEAKAGGVAKHFAFTLPFFQENNNNFGLMDYHATPLRSLFAYLQSVRELAGKEYVGDWKQKPEGVKIMRVFGDGTGLTAVLYTGKTEPCTIDLRGVPCRSLRSIDGKELVLAADGSVTFPGGLAYADLAPEARQELDTETEAMALLKLAKSYQPVQRVSSPVVYQFNHWRYPKRNRQTYYDTTNVLSVNVFNLGQEATTIAPQLVLPEGMKIATGPAATDFVLAPRSEKELVWQLDKSACPVAQYDIRLTDGNYPFAGVEVPFLNYTGLRVETFDFMNPARWQHNSSGKSTFGFDETEQAVKVSTAFDFPYGKDQKGGLNYWVFPEYVLDLPKESLEGALALTFELKLRQDNGQTNVSAPLVMLVYEGADGKSAYDSITYGTPTEEWQEFTLAIDPAKAPNYRKIRIGMCPTAAHVDYWFRNVRLHFGK